MTNKPRLIVLLCAFGLFAWFFADALWGGAMFAFRDVAHYYYPLYRFVAEQWGAGRVPLWNAGENLGQPLLGDPAAGVFYPGKLIFALPLDYAWEYKLYIMAHVLLGAATSYRLARHFRGSVGAAGLCAVSYAFCGNVLYNYCNPIYLVGTAWMPLALLTADRMLRRAQSRRSNYRWATLFGLVLAMMVLGGDPQAAYHAGLLAALYALWLWWFRSPKRRRGRLKAGATSGLPRIAKRSGLERVLSSRLAVLAFAALIALVLSAVQVLPSAEFAQNSGRNGAKFSDAIVGRFETGTHQEHTYHFSVGPWRLAEYIWPNVSGRQFPTHRRWLEIIPAEGRLWTPSLYMGLLPMLLAVGAMRFRGRRYLRRPRLTEVRAHWITWMTVWFLLASFGWFAPGWLLHEIYWAVGVDPADNAPVGAPFGGLYWFMTLVLPGYDSFRYPGKLLAVAALGLSLLAARGWDRATTDTIQAERLQHRLMLLGLLSGLGAIVAIVIRPYWSAWLAGVSPDILFGPFDSTGAANDLLAALVQTTLLCGLFWFLLHASLLHRGRETYGEQANKRRSIHATVLIVMLLGTAVDLAVANRWMLAYAPAAAWESTPEMTEAIKRDATAGGDAEEILAPIRVYRHPIWMRPAWKTQSSPGRIVESVDFDRNSLWPKYHLNQGLAVVDVEGAMMSGNYRKFLKENGANVGRYVILPNDKRLPGGRRIATSTDDATLWRNFQAIPRAWITEGNHATTDKAGDRIVDRSARGPAESCRITCYDPLRVVVDAHLERPGTIVLADQFFPGWEAAVSTEGVEGVRRVAIEPYRRVMRAVQLGGGRHQIVFRYRPRSFLFGGMLSLAGWLMLAWCLPRWGAILRRNGQGVSAGSDTCEEHDMLSNLKL